MTDRAVRLTGVFCPRCQGYAHTMALEAGPQLVRHREARSHCNSQFIAVPHVAEGRVETIPVAGRHEAEGVLRDATVRWLMELSALLGAA